MHLTIVEVTWNSLIYELGMLYIFDINRVSLHDMSGFIDFCFDMLQVYQFQRMAIFFFK